MVKKKKFSKKINSKSVASKQFAIKKNKQKNKQKKQKQKDIMNYHDKDKLNYHDKAIISSYRPAQRFMKYHDNSKNSSTEANLTTATLSKLKQRGKLIGSF